MLHPQTLNRYDQDKDSFDRELGDAVGAQLLPTSQNESPLFCLTPNWTRVWENLEDGVTGLKKCLAIRLALG